MSVRAFLFSALHDPTDNSWSSTRICGALAVVAPITCAIGLTGAAVVQRHDYSGMVASLLGGGGLTSGLAFFNRARPADIQK